MVRARRRNTRIDRMQIGGSSYGSRTDVGCVRDHNEDSLIVNPPLFVVADGMGGHEAGEVASEIAVNTLEAYAPLNADVYGLVEAVKCANKEVIRASLNGTGRPGMGTTMTAAILEGTHLVVAHVGDSRAYVLHGNSLQQITRDHSLVADMIEIGQLTPEEARVHPQRSIITRALGSDPDMRVDSCEFNLSKGDRILLCSDGLSSMVDDTDIARILMEAQEPQRAATRLANAALDAGGLDNVTVIVVDVVEPLIREHKKVARRTKFTVGIILALLLVVLGGAVFACNTYLNTVAYLIDEGGYVAVYKGVPASLGTLNFSQKVRVSNVSVSDLDPGVQNRMKSGIRVDNVETAESLIDEYKQEIEQKQTEALASQEQKSTQGSQSTQQSTQSTQAVALAVNASAHQGEGEGQIV